MKGKSPSYYARKRFQRNIPAMLGLGWLCLCTGVAIFAYFLMPDATSNANFQMVELPKQPPGTQVNYLLKPNFAAGEDRGWWARHFDGNQDRYTPVVMGSEALRFKGTQFEVQGLRGEWTTYSLPEFALPLDKFHPQAQTWKEEQGHPYARDGDEISYMNQAGTLQRASFTEIKKQLEEEMVQSRTFLMGTDGFGRDVLSRLLLGTRISMSVGLMAVLVSLVLGIGLGAMAGFFRGWVDQTVMWFVSVVWSIPTLLLAISISFVLGAGFWQLFLAIGVSMWVEVARIVRGQIFAIREMQYVEATQTMGFGNFRTIVRHILPNVLSPVIIVAAANFAAAILIEAGLSFLGLGVKAPMPSWGSMIKEGYSQVMFESGTWLAIFPGLAIILVVISLNLVGFGLRDAFDPKYDR